VAGALVGLEHATRKQARGFARHVGSCRVWDRFEPRCRRYFLPADRREFAAAIDRFAPSDAAWAEGLRAELATMPTPHVSSQKTQPAAADRPVLVLVLVLATLVCGVRAAAAAQPCGKPMGQGDATRRKSGKPPKPYSIPAACHPINADD
jgi:hypothetical protein